MNFVAGGLGDERFALDQCETRHSIVKYKESATSLCDVARINCASGVAGMCLRDIDVRRMSRNSRRNCG